MQSAKQSLLFKHFSYDIEINPKGQKRLSLTVTDSATKTEFYQKQLVLDKIGVSTLIKAFQKTKKQITFQIQHKKGGQIEMIEIRLTVESPFLRPVQQTLYIKKSRQVSQAESLKKSIDYLNKKMKQLKSQQNHDKKYQTLVQTNIKERSFAVNSFEGFSQITLEKGKYLLTWSFLGKATNQLMYIYLNSGQVPLLTNCAIYVANMTYYIPYVYRKVHTVNQASQKLTLQTYYTQSYPASIRNAIVTAKKLDL